GLGLLPVLVERTGHPGGLRPVGGGEALHRGARCGLGGLLRRWLRTAQRRAVGGLEPDPVVLLDRRHSLAARASAGPVGPLHVQAASVTADHTTNCWLVVRLPD